MPRGWGVVLIAAVVALASVKAAATAFPLRLTGKFNIQAYGYQDAQDESHRWLIPAADLALRLPAVPVTFYAAADWLGDAADDFKSSSRSRLLKGYVQYDNPHHTFFVRAGRFFLYQGVAIGVLDGIEGRMTLSPGWQVTAFAGMNGPDDRRWRREALDRSFSGGGELRWTTSSLPAVGQTALAASFASQQRDEAKERHRIGLNLTSRLCRRVTFLGNYEARATDGGLRRLSGRVRYLGGNQFASIEVAIIRPDFADYSWMGRIEIPSYNRYRFSYQRYFVNGWGAGADASFVVTDRSGFRAGAALITPYGETGYRISDGAHALSGGPWVNLRWKVAAGLTVNAQWTMTTFEWEEFQIAEQELTTVRVGGDWTPPYAKSLTLSAEYQRYRTPAMDNDGRALAGLRWNFDQWLRR